jgi:hypothetical protein
MNVKMIWGGICFLPMLLYVAVVNQLFDKKHTIYGKKFHVKIGGGGQVW